MKKVMCANDACGWSHLHSSSHLHRQEERRKEVAECVGLIVLQLEELSWRNYVQLSDGEIFEVVKKTWVQDLSQPRSMMQKGPLWEKKWGRTGSQKCLDQGSRRRNRNNLCWMVRNKPYQKNGGRLQSWISVDPNCWMLEYYGRKCAEPSRWMFQDSANTLQKWAWCQWHCGTLGGLQYFCRPPSVPFHSWKTVSQQAISSRKISCRKRRGERRSKDSVGFKLPRASGRHNVLIREKKRVCSLLINIAAIPTWDGSVRTRKHLSVKKNQTFFLI